MILLRKHPFLRPLVFLILGIYVGSEYETAELFIYSPFIISILVGCFLLVVGYMYRLYSFRWLSGVLACLFFLFSGAFICYLKQPSQVAQVVNVTAYGEVLSVEKRENNFTRVVFKPSGVDSLLSFRPGDLWMVMIKGMDGDSVKGGDKVVVKGDLHPLKGATNPYAFDYGQYLYRNSFSAQMFLNFSDVFIVDSISRFAVKYAPALVRQKCLEVFEKQGIEEQNLMVLNALLLGDRKGVDRHVYDSFIRSGAVHILAVSGLHVGILYLILNSVLSLFFSKKHPARMIISILLLFSYAFITGFSPSVSRAVLMFSIIQVGKSVHQKVDMYNLLCTSAFILLLWEPMYIYHAGFWLSHLAVAGIVAFYPMVNSLLTFSFIGWRWLWSLISVSLAAQTTTFALSLHVFGAFPQYFLLANIFILPIVAPILILSFLLLGFSSVGFLSSVISGLLNSLLSFMIEMTGYIESLPGSYVNQVWVSFSMMLVFYLLVYLFYGICERPKPRYFASLVICVFVLLIMGNFKTLSKHDSNYLIVYDTSRELMIDLVNKGQVLNIRTEGLEDRAVGFARDAFIKRVKLYEDESILIGKTIDEMDRGLIVLKLKDKQYVLVKDNISIQFNTSKTIEAEGLIISGNNKVDIEKLFQVVNSKKVIMASNCPTWIVRKWEAKAEEMGVEFYDVKKMGAYMSAN